MKILQRLTLANLRENKRRTGVTIIGVMLSTALILAVAGIVTSFQGMMVDWTIAEYGDYHDMYEEVPTEALKYIEENQHVSKYYYSEPLTDEQLGDNRETYELYQNAAYDGDMYEHLANLPADAKGKYNIYVRYDHPRDYEAIREQILNTLSSVTDDYINVRTNSDMLRYEGVMSDVTLSTLYWLATIVIGIIIVTSVFVIRNSFSISATERTRQFGMLSSIGTTPRQIRHSVYFEGLVIAAIGIPLGIVLGVVAVAILIVIMNYLLDGMMLTSIAFSMPLWVFPVAIILSFATVMLSSLIPAIRSGRMSPIEAIRGNQDTKIKPKKLRTTKFVRQTFGIGGVIASKNLKRSRKKYRTTVISIVLSVATFVGLSSFLGYGQQALGTQFDSTNIDLAVSGGDFELYHDVIERFELKDYAYYQNTHAASDNVIVMNRDAFVDFAKSVGVKTKDYSRIAIMNDLTLALSDESYKVERLYPEMKDGDTIQAEVITSRDTWDVKYENGDTQVNYDTTSTFIDLTIDKITDQRPLGFERATYQTIFISEDYYLLDQLIPDPDTSQLIAANVEDVKPITEYLENIKESNKYDHLYIIDVKETAAQQRRLYLLICIFLYGFVLVVTLIGVTNIFNTITTNVALRAKEFAMLRSVGMTTDEFNHMIRLESIMYSSKALLIGLPLGILISYGIYQSFALSLDFGYQFPIIPILISIAAVALLVTIIMHYSVKQVSKQNIIETIRSENI